LDNDMNILVPVLLKNIVLDYTVWTLTSKKRRT